MKKLFHMKKDKKILTKDAYIYSIVTKSKLSYRTA